MMPFNLSSLNLLLMVSVLLIATVVVAVKRRVQTTCLSSLAGPRAGSARHRLSRFPSGEG